MAEPGKKFLLYVDLNGVGGAGANWALIAQQDKLSLKRSTKKVDGTTKDDDGTDNDIITGRKWSLSVGGKLKYTDPAWQLIDESMDAETKIHIKADRSAAGGTSKEGLVVIDELDESGDVNGTIEYTASLAGQLSMTAAVT